MKKRLTVIIVAGLLLVVFTGCNQNQELLENTGPLPPLADHSGNGTFTLYLTADSSPGAAYTRYSTAGFHPQGLEKVLELVITVTGLEVHRYGGSDSRWYDLELEETTFDLMALDAGGWAELLSQSEIEAGTYNHLRFAVPEALVVTESGEYQAKVPSSKLKINLEFTVCDDGTTEVTIEIDPEASLVVTGPPEDPGYILKPVVRVQNVDEDEDDDYDDDDDEDEEDDDEDEEEGDED